MTMQEQIARIDRRQEDVRKFVSEMHSEQDNRAPAVWLLAIIGAAVGALLFASGVLSMKLLIL